MTCTVTLNAFAFTLKQVDFLAGCIQSIPICKFYDKDGNFLRYGLTASYGFSGGDTSADVPGSKLGAIQGSLKKSFAFTKAIVQRRYCSSVLVILFPLADWLTFVNQDRTGM